MNMLNMYLSDLSDADLLLHSVPAANNIAWQLGHLINAEAMIGQQVPGVSYPQLPASFKDQYGGKVAKEPPGGFLKKAEYLELFNKVRGITIAAVERLSDADLDKPTAGEMAKFAPTLGALIGLVGTHVMMHAGQFIAVRRALNKPVLM